MPDESWHQVVCGAGRHSRCITIDVLVAASAIDRLGRVGYFSELLAFDPQAKVMHDRDVHGVQATLFTHRRTLNTTADNSVTIHASLMCSHLVYIFECCRG
ncbi:hypothetical protein HB13667_01075 [Pseudomonas putida]|uniref:Uncharacterized protein n=1 Tax=Pseudomonas putida TaxID=303 RepID=A0A0P7DCP1_PSEPU|nr:hypothetical protein HB13667_01075 [Pseudomonas putida]RNF91538.1 hypothetical protein EFK07_08975 [Pseudomonas putida]